MKRVNLSHVSLLCIQGVGTRSVSPREIVWEGDYYQRYPATVFFLIFLRSHNIMLKMMINIIMRMVWKLMGDLVIIKSLNSTNRLLSPR